MKPTTLGVIACLGAGLLASRPAAAQTQQPPARPDLPPYGMPIDGDQAQRIMTAAEGEARRQHLPVSLAVVDTDGNLIMFKILPGAAPFTGPMAVRKAKTAAAFRVPSAALEPMAARIGPTFPELLIDHGGVPIVVDGKVIGAVAASGGSPSGDDAAIQSGLAAIR